MVGCHDRAVWRLRDSSKTLESIIDPEMQLLMKSSFETKEVSLEDFSDVEEEIWFCGKRFPPKLPL